MKRWRYVGVYAEDVMLCAARIAIGPLRQSFWAIWDRGAGERHAHTRLLPGGHAVVMDGPMVKIDARGVRAELRLGDAEPIESACPSGEGGYAWTEKRAGVPVEGSVSVGERRIEIDGACAVDDVSAGYHQRHTSWHWSAGVGMAADGRALGWNLVKGINDPKRGSERSVWVDGEPFEPYPVRFDGLDGIEFADDSRMVFTSESERARNDNLLVVRSRYRHLFGTFEGELAGIALESGRGVMEEHEAVW